MGPSRLNHTADGRRSPGDVSCRDDEARRREPPQALPRSSRFRAHDEDEETEAVGRSSTLRLKTR